MNEFGFRPSRVLQKIRSGGVASCVKLNLGDPRVVEIAALSGFDCVWLDMEHGPNTFHEIENQIRAAKIYDVDSMVRVRKGSYSDLIIPFEMDAAGIMVPHIMSVEEARTVVRNSRFQPIGRRPLDGGYSDGGYGNIPREEYTKLANSERFVILQIEDPESLDHLEEIAQIEGIDMLFFGRTDFGHAIGAPGQRIIKRRVDRERLSLTAFDYLMRGEQLHKKWRKNRSPQTAAELDALVTEAVTFLDSLAGEYIVAEEWTKNFLTNWRRESVTHKE